MYTKAKIAGHPIHSMLVAFPIAFYTAACVGYIFYAMASPNPFWFRVAYVANVAGVVMAVAAAIPGFIDWAYGVPTGSPAKLTGLFHMLLNVTALVLFGISAFVNYGRFDLEAPSATWGVLCSILGLGVTAVAGTLGWKMIATHHVGIELSPEQERIDKTAREVTHEQKFRRIG